MTTSWQQRYVRGLGYSALALALGPWGVPWGVVGTLKAIWVNIRGGVDCTAEVLAALDAQPGAQRGEVRSP